MSYANVNGQKLYYEDTGVRSSSVTIVFSHGMFLDHRMFAPQIEALVPRFRCITWDQRAHGATGTAPGDFDYWDSARDLLGLLDHLDIQRAVFAGMSQGGFPSLRAALLEPSRVQALVLMDTQTGVEDPEKIPGYDQMLQSWAEHGLTGELADMLAQIILGPDVAETEAWQARWRELPFAQVRQAYNALVNREDDITPRLAELNMPALVIHGEADATIDPEIARALARALPDAEYVGIAGAGHAANLTHPQAINSPLIRFLEAI